MHTEQTLVSTVQQGCAGGGQGRSSRWWARPLLQAHPVPVKRASNQPRQPRHLASPRPAHLSRFSDSSSRVRLG